MKKSLKITLIILGILFGTIILDTLQAKIFNNSPLLKMRCDYNGGTTLYIDKGIFVDHYYCTNKEEKTLFKGMKYTCPVASQSNVTYGVITDIKDKYIVIKLVNDNEAEITLNNNPKLTGANNLIIGQTIKFVPISIKEIYPSEITTNEIIIVNADFEIKIEKSDKKEIIQADIINDEIGNSYAIKYYGIDKVVITINDKEYDFIEAIKSNVLTFDDILSHLDLVDTYKDGESKLYHSKPNIYSDNSHRYSILKCNTTNGNKDIYIGNYDMTYEESFCK